MWGLEEHETFDVPVVAITRGYYFVDFELTSDHTRSADIYLENKYRISIEF